MLTQERKGYFTELLIQRLDELIAEANNTISDFAGPKDEPSDFVDRASMGSDTDFSLCLREREGKLIVKIKTALEKLEEGDFGICEECGEEISEERLKVRPMAALCIKCKKKQEAVEKTRGL
ncbi:MAG: TraR/DksA family transcriptional regulator [Desulfobacterales bacterium]|jgi:DnaK suppressor protein